MIEAARRQVSLAANAALTTLHWQLGYRVRTEVLEGKRAEYGSEIVAALGQRLEAQHGRGFGEKNRRRMVQFAEVFPDRQIVRPEKPNGHFLSPGEQFLFQPSERHLRQHKR